MRLEGLVLWEWNCEIVDNIQKQMYARSVYGLENAITMPFYSYHLPCK